MIGQQVAAGNLPDFFTLESYRVATERDGEGNLRSKATVRLSLNDQVREATSEGCGPVHALDCALRKALGDVFRCLEKVRLADYKVRVVDSDRATAARVRVLIQTSDSEQSWSTVGVSDNILEASWQALADAVSYKLHKDRSASGDNEKMLDVRC